MTLGNLKIGNSQEEVQSGTYFPVYSQARGRSVSTFIPAATGVGPIRSAAENNGHPVLKSCFLSLALHYPVKHTHTHTDTNPIVNPFCSYFLRCWLCECWHSSANRPVFADAAVVNSSQGDGLKGGKRPRSCLTIAATRYREKTNKQTKKWISCWRTSRSLGQGSEVGSRGGGTPLSETMDDFRQNAQPPPEELLGFFCGTINFDISSFSWHASSAGS